MNDPKWFFEEFAKHFLKKAVVGQFRMAISKWRLVQILIHQPGAEKLNDEPDKRFIEIRLFISSNQLRLLLLQV